MRFTKLNGILEEVTDLDPHVDLVDFLSQKLELPLDKAEVLAARMEVLRKQNKHESGAVKTLLEKNIPDDTSDGNSHSIECLSDSEFSHFVKWLLEELGFEVLPEKIEADFGFDVLAIKEGKKIAFLGRKYPSTLKVTDAITIIGQDAKRKYGCERIVALTTTCFSVEAVVEAQKIEIELWDADTLSSKIAEIRKKWDTKERTQFPQYQESLLWSLQQLVEKQLFLVESRAGEKYDLFVPWIKYPLLTYQTNSNNVTRCVYRIKYNNPVSESEGKNLVYTDHDGNRQGPNDEEAYYAILQYLKQFLE